MKWGVPERWVDHSYGSKKTKPQQGIGHQKDRAQRAQRDIACSFASTTTMNAELPANAPGLVGVMNNRTDLERAQVEHWYRIPLQSAPDGVRDIRWNAS